MEKVKAITVLEITTTTIGTNATTCNTTVIILTGNIYKSLDSKQRALYKKLLFQI